MLANLLLTITVGDWLQVSFVTRLCCVVMMGKKINQVPYLFGIINVMQKRRKTSLDPCNKRREAKRGVCTCKVTRWFLVVMSFVVKSVKLQKELTLHPYGWLCYCREVKALCNENKCLNIKMPRTGEMR